MTISSKTKNARTAAIKAVKQSREAIGTAQHHSDDARSSGFYSEEGTKHYIGGWVREAKKTSTAALDRVTRQTKEARTEAEKNYRNARKVSDADRAQAAAILAPAIAAANTDPEALVRAYERRAPNSQAERVVLEDAIQVMLDAGLGGPALSETWERTRNRTAEAVISEAERDAAEDLEAVEKLEGYLSGARVLSEADLEAIESGRGQQFGARIETSRDTLARYEREAEDTGGVRTLTDSRTEQDEPDAEIIRKWREQQAQKRAESEGEGSGGSGEGSEGEGGEGAAA